MDEYTEEIHPEELQNQNPEIVNSFIYNVSDFFAYYGWYFLIGVIAVIYIYNKYVNEYIQQYLQRKSEAEYAAKYHKDPDMIRSRMLAMEDARRKMQEKLDKDAEEFKAKQLLKEEKKRIEWLERHNAVPTGTKLGYREQNTTDDKKKSKSLRPEYNPLAGESSSSYRAPKRSACGGGGCG